MEKTKTDVALEDKRISTEQLMPGINQLVIVHNEQDYKLRITRNGKLILTK